jgi:hypothetical protein
MEASLMRQLAPISLASLVVALAACGPTASAGSPGEASETPVGLGGGGQSAAPSTAGPPTFTTGPGGAPIGTWSLTLVGGPTPGEYGGTDEMICTGIAGGPMSVTFQPVGSPPVQQVDGTTDGPNSSILVSAGGLESGATYQAVTNQEFQSVVLGEARIQAGVLTFSIHGTQQYPGENVTREISLSATCPLFPAESDG